MGHPQLQHQCWGEPGWKRGVWADHSSKMVGSKCWRHFSQNYCIWAAKCFPICFTCRLSGAEAGAGHALHLPSWGARVSEVLLPSGGLCTRWELQGAQGCWGWQQLLVAVAWSGKSHNGRLSCHTAQPNHCFPKQSTLPLSFNTSIHPSDLMSAGTKNFAFKD